MLDQALRAPETRVLSFLLLQMNAYIRIFFQCDTLVLFCTSSLTVYRLVILKDKESVFGCVAVVITYVPYLPYVLLRRGVPP